MNFKEDIAVDEEILGPERLGPSNESRAEWEYAMRRDMQQIIPGLFLGPYASANKSQKDNLMEAGITHIVCVRQDIESHLIKPHHPESFVYLVIEMADSPLQNIIQFFPRFRDFVDDCLNRNGKVLVHGTSGISRSAALVISYIMDKYLCSSSDALKFVQNNRFCVYPNEGFRRQLFEYEPILRARIQSDKFTSDDDNVTRGSSGSFKRNHSELEEMNPTPDDYIMTNTQHSDNNHHPHQNEMMSDSSLMT